MNSFLYKSRKTFDLYSVSTLTVQVLENKLKTGKKSSKKLMSFTIEENRYALLNFTKQGRERMVESINLIMVYVHTGISTPFGRAFLSTG